MAFVQSEKSCFSGDGVVTKVGRVYTHCIHRVGGRGGGGEERQGWKRGLGGGGGGVAIGSMDAVRSSSHTNRCP